MGPPPFSTPPPPAQSRTGGAPTKGVCVSVRVRGGEKEREVNRIEKDEAVDCHLMLFKCSCCPLVVKYRHNSYTAASLSLQRGCLCL